MNATEFLTIFNNSISGQITLNELCSMLSAEKTFSAEQQGVLHLLVHYVTDQDLRAKDKDYEKYLLDQLRFEISKLTQEI
jgi:hypothetical protein